MSEIVYLFVVVVKHPVSSSWFFPDCCKVKLLTSLSIFVGIFVTFCGQQGIHGGWGPSLPKL